MLIDLHTHSTVSDGTDPPERVVAVAAAQDVDVLALTEHDTAPWLDPAAEAGWRAAVEAARSRGVTLVGGTEISCHWWQLGQRCSAHLLGYLFRETDPIRTALAGVLASRATRMEQMVQRIQDERGSVIDLDDVRQIALGGPGGLGAQNGQPVLGRPHLARALAEKGLCTYEEAFGDRWLGRKGPYYVRKESLPLEEAVGLVRESGGVSVLAHPARSGYEVPDSVISRLADAGLDGIEADHPWHSDPDRWWLARLAAEHGLLVTGSSDYHGKIKNETVGARVTRPDVYQAVVALAAQRGGTAPVVPDPVQPAR